MTFFGMNPIKRLFDGPIAKNEALYQELKSLAEPRINYLVAMTPRSGSSFLCDQLTRTRVLGRPDEYLNGDTIPGFLKWGVPAETPDEYLRHALKAKKTRNGVAGIKASWFQFRDFCQCLDDESFVLKFKYIYLSRPNLALQAVSLFKATESSVFHSVAAHDGQALRKLKDLQYDFAKIDYWYRHIAAQEEGWQQFFSSNRISPLIISYDDVCSDWRAIAGKIGLFVGLRTRGLKRLEDCVAKLTPRFNKLGDGQSLEWAERYLLERGNGG